MNYIYLILLSIIFVSCSKQPKVDSQSKVLLLSSMAKVNQSLSAEDKVKFDKSLGFLFKRTEVTYVGEKPKMSRLEAMAMIHDKTAEQIMSDIDDLMEYEAEEERKSRDSIVKPCIKQALLPESKSFPENKREEKRVAFAEVFCNCVYEQSNTHSKYAKATFGGNHRMSQRYLQSQRIPLKCENSAMSKIRSK